ncbi:MAG TPA: hypothetical protein VGD56_11750, partial [Gemmatirosa sp.]
MTAPAATVGSAMLAVVPAAAQTSYREPPAPIAQMLDAEPLPVAVVSPDRRWLVQLRRRGLPPISEVGAPELRIAGLRINPRTNGASRDVSFTGVTFTSVDGGVSHALVVPGVSGELRLGPPLWAPDARHVAFTLTRPTGIALLVADVPSPEATGPVVARALGAMRLNAVTTAAPCAWATPARIACLTVPAARGAAPAPATIPTGPIVQESDGRAAPNPTFEDLLKSPADEALFDYYATAQVAIATLDGRWT